MSNYPHTLPILEMSANEEDSSFSYMSEKGITLLQRSQVKQGPSTVQECSNDELLLFQQRMTRDTLTRIDLLARNVEQTRPTRVTRTTT
jgi:hypothetical protein